MTSEIIEFEFFKSLVRFLSLLNLNDHVDGVSVLTYAEDSELIQVLIPIAANIVLYNEGADRTNYVERLFRSRVHMKFNTAQLFRRLT